jgi:hypothetical protein
MHRHIQWFLDDQRALKLMKIECLFICTFLFVLIDKDLESCI